MINGVYDPRDIILLTLVIVWGVCACFHLIGWLTEPSRGDDREKR